MLSGLKRFSVYLGFFLLGVLLIVAALATRHQLASQVKAVFWVDHTRQVLFGLERSAGLVKDAETGQRGFLYTNDAGYLDPYNRARKSLNQQLDEVARLTADNPEQQVAIAELKRLAASKIDELQQTIDLQRAGKQAEARAVVLSGRGEALGEQIRALVDRMEAREADLQAKRLGRYDRAVAFTVACLYTGTALGLLGLALLAFFIVRQMRLRDALAYDLRTREEWFRITLTSIGDAVVATDARGIVTFLNPVAESLMGRSSSECIGRGIHEVFPIFNEGTGAPAESPVDKVMALGHIVGLANHTVLKRSDGQLIPIEDSAAPIEDDQKQLIGVVLVFRDATHERKANELLRRSEKLSAAARLSATVAHEINNPLAAVSNLIYLARENATSATQVVEHLELADRELARVAHITRQTLGFYRESQEPQRVEMQPILESILELYANKIRSKNIAVHCQFGRCPSLQAVGGELRQALSNVITNAIDAVPVGGNIRIDLHTVDVAGRSELEVVVEDDGPGIPRTHLGKLFEPFFTTKENVGTGLGLWVAREIAQRHGGSISVLDGGHSDHVAARFILRLPIQSKTSDAALEV